MKSAEDNATRMVVTSPISGMVVLRMVWRVNQQVEIQEGEEARPGMPIMQVVDPSAMLVRVKVNQADVHLLQVGQPARISLDAYPDLQFQGRVEHVAPVGYGEHADDACAQLRCDGQHQREPSEAAARLVSGRRCRAQRKDNVIVVPRDAVTPAPRSSQSEGGRENDVFTVRVLDGGSARSRTVTLGAMSDHEVIIASGLEPGVTVQRHVAR